jgi:RNA polymerase sigma-70 factor (ECF subfamily)
MTALRTYHFPLCELIRGVGVCAMNNQPSDHTRDAGDVTVLLRQAGDGSLDARERLLAMVYDELRVIARSQMRGERSSHTLGATGLVNESYLRLFRASADDISQFGHRHAFFSAAATAMRRILIDHARAKAAMKRGGDPRSVAISADVLEASERADPEQLLLLDAALDALAAEDERAATVVRLRFFAGRQIHEIAEILGLADRTIKRDWEFARARLQQIIERSTPHNEGRT